MRHGALGKLWPCPDFEQGCFFSNKTKVQWWDGYLGMDSPVECIHSYWWAIGISKNMACLPESSLCSQGLPLAQGSERVWKHQVWGKKNEVFSMARAILCYLENWKNGALLVSMHQKSNTVLSDRFCLEIKRSTDPENIYKRTINSEIFRAPIATSEKFDFFSPRKNCILAKAWESFCCSWGSQQDLGSASACFLLLSEGIKRWTK